MDGSFKPIALGQQVRRNPKRFPADFLLELSDEEIAALLSQNVIPSRRSLGGRPLAFTERGIAILSSVLTSERAIEVNIAIMRTFVCLRESLATHEDLAERLEKLEWRHAEQEGKVQYVSDTLQQLIEALRRSRKAPLWLSHQPNDAIRKRVNQCLGCWLTERRCDGRERGSAFCVVWPVVVQKC